MKIPLHVQLRRQSNNLLNKLLSSFTQHKSDTPFIDKEHVKTILIIRPNYRIGNLIFLTPLLNTLHKEIPHAKIDIIVGMKLAGDILNELPNVDKVIAIPRELLKQPLQMYKFIKETREKKYDVALNIMAASTSSQLVTSLINAEYKASYYNEKSWGRLTHTTPFTHLYKHIGLESLELVRLFNIEPPMQNLKFDIRLKEVETTEAKKDLAELLKKNSIPKEQKIIALFRNARFDKRITDEWWQEWFEALDVKRNNITVIDILSPDIPKKLNAQVLEYSNKKLRLLGAFFHECDLFVSADTGPMHLAVASGAKVLALFKKTHIIAYSALGEGNQTIDINGLSAEDVAREYCDF